MQDCKIPGRVLISLVSAGLQIIMKDNDHVYLWCIMVGGKYFLMRKVNHVYVNFFNYFHQIVFQRSATFTKFYSTITIFHFHFSPTLTTFTNHFSDFKYFHHLTCSPCKSTKFTDSAKIWYGERREKPNKIYLITFTQYSPTFFSIFTQLSLDFHLTLSSNI